MLVMLHFLSESNDFFSLWRNACSWCANLAAHGSYILETKLSQQENTGHSKETSRVLNLCPLTVHPVLSPFASSVSKFK